MMNKTIFRTTAEINNNIVFDKQETIDFEEETTDEEVIDDFWN